MKTNHASRDLLALFLLAIITLGFFWPILLQGQWLPQGGGDLVSFLWPQYHFAAEAIKNGSLPLWNPHLYAGAPFLADNQSGILYPINLFAFLIFPQITYQVMEGLVIFHIWLAGVCMYVALRLWPGLTPRTTRGAQAAPQPPVLNMKDDFQERGSVAPLSRQRDALSGESHGEASYGLGVKAALLGAIAFMFNDVMITHIGNLNLIAAAAWLPLVVALFARGLAHRDVRTTLVSGVVFAIALLAGHAQMTAITLIGMAVIAGWQLVLRLRQAARRGCATDAGKSKADVSRVLMLSALALIVAFGLSAAQLLPSLEMTQYSLRSGLSYEEATAYSLPPIALASTFSPLLFGRGASDFWGPWQRVETSFVGVIPLLLAGFAFTRKRSNPAWFFAVLGLIGVLIALGKYTPIYSLIHALPIFNGLRVPARFILLTNFSLSALAAIGFHRFSTEAISSRRAFGRVLGVLFIGGLTLVAAYQSAGVPGHLDNLPTALFVFALSVLAMVFFIGWQPLARSQNQKSKILIVGLAAIEVITLGSRVEIDPNDPTLGYRHQAVIDFLRGDQSVYRIENASNAWQPDAALMHNVSDISGLFNPLGLANYETYRGGMGNRGSALYNLLGVKYVLANKNEPPGDASFVPVFNADPQIDVYLNTHALPRALLIDRVRIVQSGEEAWQAIHAPDFDPATEVVVQGNPVLSAEENLIETRTLAIGAVKNDRVELNIETSSPTLLVLSDVYYPGWVATIDDQPATIYPANFAFRAVLVPAGSHRVVFQFEPVTWRVGLTISALVLVGLIGSGVIAWRRRRGTRPRRF